MVETSRKKCSWKSQNIIKSYLNSHQWHMQNAMPFPSILSWMVFLFRWFSNFELIFSRLTGLSMWSVGMKEGMRRGGLKAWWGWWGGWQTLSWWGPPPWPGHGEGSLGGLGGHGEVGRGGQLHPSPRCHSQHCARQERGQERRTPLQVPHIDKYKDKFKANTNTKTGQERRTPLQVPYIDISTLHYWLRWSIGFWNVQKVAKSRHFFLIQ